MPTIPTAIDNVLGMYLDANTTSITCVHITLGESYGFEVLPKKKLDLYLSVTSNKTNDWVRHLTCLSLGCLS